jgi:hypothetical protein
MKTCPFPRNPAFPASFSARVARWFLFKPKIPIWANFGGPYIDWKMLVYFMVIRDISWPFSICYGNLVMLWSFGTFCVHLVHFFPFWDHAPKKSGNPALRQLLCGDSSA